MNNILEMINDSNVNIAGALFKLTLSLILGGIVGLERRHKGQIAGMRTFALISMGATMAMLISIFIPQEYMGLKNGDPGRIAAQVISGIGFLGAGAIIQMKGSVRGLTTAAGIWITACIGLGVGAGMYTISVAATLLIIFILMILDQIEKRIFKGGEQKIIRLKASGIIEDTTTFRNCLHQHKVHISDTFIRYDYSADITTINFMIRSKDNADFIRIFKEIHSAGNILSLTLTNEVNN